MTRMSFDRIAVIGLGYVGLPLSLQFARSGVSVLGLDTDESKVESIKAGESYLKHFSSEEISISFLAMMRWWGFASSSL